MKRNLYIILMSLICIGISNTLYGQSHHVPIVPQPNAINMGIGVYVLRDGLVVETSEATIGSAVGYLREKLLHKHGIFSRLGNQRGGDIRFSMLTDGHAGNHEPVEEAYRLMIDNKGVHIQAQSAQGFFYATISLLQLIDYYRSGSHIELPYMTIEDSPRFEWRGFMLDESRHFFGKEKVKQLLDWMAYYKLNKFHWHLTDEPAWRIEIKKYPMLGLIGGIGAYTDPIAPARFYTHDEIKEIVLYAAERHIEVIPEIDMPGHATAANRAYPQFSGGGNPKHPDFTFHPGKEGTYRYLTNILKEINVLFPSGIIHLGGDEVSYGDDMWDTDSAVDSLKRQHGFTSNAEVEMYFMRRMADSVYNMGAKIAVWDELADSELPTDKTVQYWWRHDKISQLELALRNGYSVVICPRIPFYFDFVQQIDHRVGRKWSGAFSSLQQVYDYDFESLLAKQQKDGQILGAQANLWTETILTPERLDFMVFPRIAALAETVWTQEEVKDYPQFEELLKSHLKLYKADNIYFYDPFRDSNPEPRVEVSTRQYLDNPE